MEDVWKITVNDSTVEKGLLRTAIPPVPLLIHYSCDDPVLLHQQVAHFAASSGSKDSCTVLASGTPTGLPTRITCVLHKE